MVGTARPAGSKSAPPTKARTSSIGEALEHQRLTTKTRQVEGVVAALQTRRREGALSGVVPLPLDQALDDFTRQLAALRARTQALLAAPEPSRPPRAA